jgi:hypothetical protein
MEMHSWLLREEKDNQRRQDFRQAKAEIPPNI